MVAVLSIGVAALMHWAVDVRDDSIVRHEMLPVDFLHVDHNGVGCADCHHNFIDSTGMGDCYRCHKSDESLAPVMQETFHRLCRDCHVTEARLGNESGPVRACDQCHRENDAFM